MGVVERLVLAVEKPLKEAIWDCRMCGQCILHSTGLSCPMRCPKSLRNGPCGGVRANGNCEVDPDMRCVWVEAWERSRRLPLWRDHILFHEYFHGDNGAGIGASHQTGWTGVVAKLLEQTASQVEAPREATVERIVGAARQAERIAT